MGRKTPINISLFGFVILTACYVIVVNFNLPLQFMLIGHIISGLLGDYGNLAGCSFSYLSDITTPEQRTLRMAVLETGIGMSYVTDIIIIIFLRAGIKGCWILKEGRNPREGH